MAEGFRSAVTSVHAGVFATDLKALAAFPAPMVPQVSETKTAFFLAAHSSQFLHAVLDELCGRVPSYDSYQESLKCRPQDIQRLKNGYKLFVAQVLGRGLKSEDILHDLGQGGLAPPLATVAGDVIVSRYEEVRHALSEAPSCGPFLKDFDWKVSLTVASDRFASLATPTSVWSFDVATPVSDAQLAADPESKKEAQKKVVLEMNQTELKRFVDQLETVAGVMRSVV